MRMRSVQSTLCVALTLACLLLAPLPACGSDYYEVLGVKKTSTLREIKQAYRKLALELHPDKLGPNATEADHDKFLLLARAYEILSDEDSRAYYDQHGEASDGPRGPGFKAARQYNQQNFDMFIRFPLGSFEFHWKQRTRPQAPSVAMELGVTLEQIVEGVQVPINITRQRFCSVCGGTGSEQPLHVHTHKCEACDGSGRRMVLKSDEGGYAHIVHAECSLCEGTGRIVEKPCSVCNGTRYETDVKELLIDVKPGTPSGAKIPRAGEGNHLLHHRPGDAFFQVKYLPHENYTVDANGVDLVYTAKIGLVDALLGFTRAVPLLGGASMLVEHSVVTFSGYRQEFMGHGLINPEDGNRGLLIVEFRVTFPKRLSNVQRRVLREVLDDDELAVLEDVIRLANAGEAEASSHKWTQEDYELTFLCSSNPFVCFRSELAEAGLLLNVPRGSSPNEA